MHVKDAPAQSDRSVRSRQWWDLLEVTEFIGDDLTAIFSTNPH